MERIEISPLDKKDLLELLDYAKEKKREDFESADKREKWDDTKWWEIRIQQLKMVLNGYDYTSTVQSSYQTIDREMNKKDKDRYRYKQRLENELVDFIDYMDEKKGEELW